MPAAASPFNQSPPYEGVNLYESDAPLKAAVAANGGEAHASELSAFGARWGTEAMLELARQANENPPKLRSFDSRGNRLDRVEFHPAYHRLMGESLAAGLHASTWAADATPAAAPAQVVRTARYYMAAQVETGHLCPVTMTRAAVAALVVEPPLARTFCPHILAREYDRRWRPWWEKRAITVGMGMTERQGGTDVRSNSTRAEPAGEGYAITGQKWFMSAPMCDAFLVLAQAAGGLTCFLMPRFRPDGRVNGLQFQRLKDKLGNRSNASSEVEFVNAFGWRIGQEGRGIPTIISMVQLTRLDCAIASAGITRMALAQALHHARHRTVFQKHLVDQPLMRGVLADLALEVEAATALLLRLARAFDLAGNDAREALRARLVTPAAKYWICKSAPGLIYEAMECLGGNGYVEESVLPRLYREAPVNAIWEGSGNVMCLDVLRAVRHEPEACRALLDELAAATAELPGAAVACDGLARGLTAADAERQARHSVERLTVLAAAAALAESASPMAEVYARIRLRAPRGPLLGTSEISADDAARLLQRALPG
ncbi:MAG: isovaleryl-CoA dehydrogenase [Xanthobacteraceae bacterium]